MKNKLKVLFSVLLIAVILSSFLIPVSAELTATARIGCSNTNPKIGDTIEITAIYNASENINAIGGTLTFNNSVLEYVSGEDCNLISANKVKVAFSGASAKSFYFVITFKVKAAGKSSIYLGDCVVSNGSSEISVADQSITVNAITGNEGQSSTPSSSSSDANLTSLRASAGSLSPAFKSNITEYTVNVPHDKTDGILYCTTSDKYAKISITGSRELKVGKTVRSVKVTAPDGTTKTYTVTFNRAAKEEKPEETDTNNITYGDGSYKITDDYEGIKTPNAFSVDIVKINDKEYTALVSVSKNITLVCIQNQENAEEKILVLYKDGNVTEFKYIESASDTLLLQDIEPEQNISDKFYLSEIEIGGSKIPCYKYTDTAYSDYAVVYCESAKGTLGYYRYDTKEETIQRFAEFSELKNQNEKPTNVTVNTARRNLIVVLAFLCAQVIIAIIVVAVVLIVKSIKAKK